MPQAWTSAPRNVVSGLVMVVTQLNLEFRFQGRKLRGFRCELTRRPREVFPETVLTIMGQIVVPVLLSGLGLLGAGLVMNTVQVRMGRRRAAQGPGGPGDTGRWAWGGGEGPSGASASEVRGCL